MGKKRKADAEPNAQKSHPIEVIVEDVTNHPLCLHGPTLLFSSEKGRYFACSLCRNIKDCTVHIDEEDWQKESVRKRNEKYYNLIPKIEKVAAWKFLNEVKSRHYTDRAYCDTCKELYIISTQGRKHLKEHKVFPSLTDEQLARPSTWLPTLEENKKEAQYMFTKKSVSTVLGILRNNNIKNIICIGTPSIHESAQAHEEFDSMLLDYDTRHRLFHAPNKFLWYNMFNNFLFNGNEDEKFLKNFFRKSKDCGVAVVMDPPFGGRVEPLVQTVRELSAAYSKYCDKSSDDIIPVIWAFPYFSEPYIKNLMPEVKMHDYQVEYENHKKFQNGKNGRKHGSPVRFFTNLPFRTIDLSNDSDYKYCDKCKYWVSASNKHCNKCRECTSKNGMTYRHCAACARCVKPTYTHCAACARCVLHAGHACGATLDSRSQSCYNCNEKGHKKSACPQKKNEVFMKKQRNNA